MSPDLPNYYCVVGIRGSASSSRQPVDPYGDHGHPVQRLLAQARAQALIISGHHFVQISLNELITRCVALPLRMSRRRKIETKAGSRWHKLTAVSPAEPLYYPGTKQFRERWLYRCDCGAELVLQTAWARFHTRQGWCSCTTCCQASFHTRQGWCSCGVCYRTPDAR